MDIQQPATLAESRKAPIVVGSGDWLDVPVYYQDASVTIYHGDSFEIIPKLGRFDLMLTDPPYGLKMSGGTWGKKMDATYKAWDAETKDLTPLLTKARDQVIWGGNYFTLKPSRGWLIWKKPHLPTLSDAELAWTNADRNIRVFESTRNDGETKEHPTQKPLDLMTWCLSFYPDAQTVLDPFGGSGTTARACKDLGKQCVLIEREERYCEIAARRLSQEVLPLGTSNSVIGRSEPDHTSKKPL